MVVYSADVVIEAIDDYYDDLLGREPNNGEVRFYLAAYRTNPSLDAIRNGIARSPEARDALAAVFRDVQGREAGPDSLERLQQQLVDGASLDDVREDLQGSIAAPEEPGGEPPSPDEVRDAVNGLYQDVLGRDADGAALEFWQQAVSRGTPLASLRTALATSNEARGVINGLYEDVLGREGDDAGLRFFQTTLAGDDASLDDVRAALAGTDEARLAINGLYGDVLGRDGEDAGLDFFQAALAGDDASLDNLRVALGASNEARLAVNSLYEEVLGREGDGAGLDFFQQSLAGDADLDDVRETLAGSDEARAALDGLYQDVLGREGDAAGLDFWQGALAAGNIELDDICALFADLALTENDGMATVEATSTRMAFLVPTEEPALLTATSGPDVAFSVGQIEWHPSSSNPLRAAGFPTALSVSAEVVAGARLPFVASVPSPLDGLSDPSSVSLPVVG